MIIAINIATCITMLALAGGLGFFFGMALFYGFMASRHRRGGDSTAVRVLDLVVVTD